MKPKYPKQETPQPRYPVEIPRRPIPCVPDERKGRPYGASVTWVCSRCGTPNGLHARYCANCYEANPKVVNYSELSIVKMVEKMIYITEWSCTSAMNVKNWKLVFEGCALIDFRNEIARGHVCKEEFAENGTFMGIKVVVLPGLEPGDVFLLPKNVEEL